MAERVIVQAAARWAVAALFIAAGAMKVGDPRAFARAVVEYQLVPDVAAPAIGVFLPWWEIFAGGLVLGGPLRRGALMVLTCLAAGFLGVGAITLARGLSPECACFGALSGRVGPATIAFEVALLACCAALMRGELRRATERALQPPT